MMKPVDVRTQLIEAIRLDLVGPENGSDLEREVLSQAPSRWYLTGFLVPLEAADDQKCDQTAQDEIDSGDRNDASDDDTTPESSAARRAFFPSSIGLSLLVPEATRSLDLEVHWGDYHPQGFDDQEKDPDVADRSHAAKHISVLWQRTPHSPHHGRAPAA